MKLRKLATTIGLTVGSVLVAANSAQAGSFTFDIEQNNGVGGNTFLNSITQDETEIKSFSYVKEVKVWDNEKWTGGNTGAASTDRGINAISPHKENEDPTTDEVADFLANNNLNNIIDTEDKGIFNTQLFFDSTLREDNKGLDSLFFFERGKNSNMIIQAIGEDGKLAGNKLLLRGTYKEAQKDISEAFDAEIKQQDAGFSIKTMEIKDQKNPQKVGFWGVSLADLGVEDLKGVQIFAGGSKYNGPDFKLIARKSEGKNSVAVPEPGTIIGLGSVAALAFFRRRKSK